MRQSFQHDDGRAGHMQRLLSNFLDDECGMNAINTFDYEKNITQFFSSKLDRYKKNFLRNTFSKRINVTKMATR